MSGGDEDTPAEKGPLGWHDEPAGAPHPHFSPAEHERLDLDDHDHLPWLESEDDEYFPSVSIGRVVLAIVTGLLFLGAIVAGIWWYTHRHVAGQPVADGSTVSPPPGPYKEAPRDPGGKTFQGTGDTSYAVSRGQDREAQLADSGGGGTTTGGSGNAADAKPGKGSKVLPADGGAVPDGGLVQIGAYSSQALAASAWTRLSSQHETLASQHHRIVEGQADIGTVWRLQVITGAGGGNALCAKLHAEGLACQVKH